MSFGLNKSPATIEREQQQREMNFAREQSAFQAGTSVQDEQFYMMQQEAQNDLVKWQQDLDDEVEMLKHALRSETKTSDGWVKKKFGAKKLIDGKQVIVFEDMPPLINELGVQMIEEEIRPLMSRNLINSNLDENRILTILRNTSNTVADNMCDNYELFGAKFLDFDLITRLIKNIITPAPYRALNDGERRHQRTINKRLESFIDTRDKESRGSFLGMRRKNG